METTGRKRGGGSGGAKKTSGKKITGSRLWNTPAGEIRNEAACGNMKRKDASSGEDAGD